MKRTILASLFILLCSYAMASDDLCQHLNGHWEGSFDIIDPNICALYGGHCRDIFVEAEVEGTVYENYYMVHLKPSKGTGGDIIVFCKNNYMASPLNRGNIIQLSQTGDQVVLDYIDPIVKAQAKHTM